MARRRANIVRFPGADGVVITDAEHGLLLNVVGPFYGAAVEDFLMAAPAVRGGHRIDLDHPAMQDLFSAIACEAHGYQKLDDERDEGSTPASGGTAEQLVAIYDRLEGHLA